MTLEDEDAVLLELAEIERLEAESLLLAMPEAPVEPIEAGSRIYLNIPLIWLLLVANLDFCEMSTDEIVIEKAVPPQAEAASLTAEATSSVTKTKVKREAILA